MLIRTISAGDLQTNVYLLGEEESRCCAFIDPGAGGREMAALCRSLGYQPVAIFLTHGHFDHYADVPVLQEEWPELLVYIDQKDWKDVPAGGQRQLFCPTLKNLRFYGEGDVLSVGKLQVQVLETPGHSSGSVTLRVENVLFTGDTLFAGTCGRTDLERGSMQEMLCSLKRLAQLPGEYIVYPGHGGSSTLDTERCGNPYIHMAARQL